MAKNKECNTKTIFKHLCKQMDKLSLQEISVEEAKAQASLCKQANNILKYELERAKTVAKYPDQIREIED